MKRIEKMILKILTLRWHRVPLWVIFICVVFLLCIWFFALVFKNEIKVNIRTNKVGRDYFEINNATFNQYNFNYKSSPRRELYEIKARGLELPNMIDVVFARQFDDVTQKATTALKNRDYERVQSLASESKMLGQALVEDAKDLGIRCSQHLVERLKESARVFSEAQLSLNNYGAITGYCATVKEAFAVCPTNEAFFDIAKARLAGRDFILPSLDDLEDKLMYGLDFAKAYIEIIAEKGYLHPLSITLGANTIHGAQYEKAFELSKPLKYRKVFQLKTLDDNGVEMKSNLISSRYLGIGRNEGYDFSRAIDILCKKPSTPAPIKISFNKEKMFDDNDVPNLAGSIEGYVTYDAYAQYNYDQTKMRHLRVYSDVVQGDDKLAYDKYGTIPVPEPSTSILLIVGCCALALKRKRA